MGRIPNSAASVSNTKKKPTTENNISFDTFYPAWRLGKFDYNSKWGLKSLLGSFSFHVNPELEDRLLENEDEALIDALNKLNGKTFDSVDEFWEKLSKNTNDSQMTSEISRLIVSDLVRDGFFSKIYPKLKAFESMTWREILEKKHQSKGKMVSNNHNVDVANFCKEAKDRLADLRYAVDQLFSLRLEAKIRIYGFRVHNYLEILWVDLEHEVYPVS